MSSLCLRIRADPQLADVGLVDYCVRGAWCVMSACVLQVCTYMVGSTGCQGTVLWYYY